MTKPQAVSYLSHWIATRADPNYLPDTRVLNAITLLQDGYSDAMARARIGWFIRENAQPDVRIKPDLVDQMALEAWEMLRQTGKGEIKCAG